MSSTETKSANSVPSLRGRVISYLLVAFTLLYFGFLAFLPSVSSRWLDFPVYWEAGEKALKGLTVYDVTGHFQYKYSPFVALLFGKLLSGMSFESASFFFQKTMLAVWVLLFLKISRYDFRRVAVLLLFFGNALRLDLELGQVNALVVYLLIFLFGTLTNPKTWKSDFKFGLFFSFAVQLKLFSLVLLPLLVFRKEWRKLFFGIVGIPLLSISGVAIVHGIQFALSENQAWLGSLFQSTDHLLLSAQNVGLLGLFVRFFGTTIGKILWLSSGLFLLVYFWKNRSQTVEWFRNRLLFVITVFNPLVWSYWILFAFPLFVELIEESKRRRVQWIPAIISVYIFAAFNGQHAKWAWSGGILLALFFVALATSKVSKELWKVKEQVQGEPGGSA